VVQSLHIIDQNRVELKKQIKPHEVFRCVFILAAIRFLIMYLPTECSFVANIPCFPIPPHKQCEYSVKTF